MRHFSRNETIIVNYNNSYNKILINIGMWEPRYLAPAWPPIHYV